MTKAHILSEIKRTAIANSGVPLGCAKFANETGIRETDWKGRFWARWGDAVQEAGFAPNKLKEAYGEPELLNQYAKLSLDLGRLPAPADIRLSIKNGGEYANWGTFTSHFGGKPQLVAKLREYCQTRTEYAAVIPLCDQYVPRNQPAADEVDTREPHVGYVYLIRHGKRREFKIGRTNNALRREGEIAIELPERVRPVHVIKTDDPSGIEAYWHRRFADRRKNGEWFELNAADVAAFKRRKFM